MTTNRLTKAQRVDVQCLDNLILAHRASVVDWFDARFPDAAHIPHPDRRRALEDGST